MRDKDLLKLLLQNGWHVVNINGSHHKLRKGNATEVRFTAKMSHPDFSMQY